MMRTKKILAGIGLAVLATGITSLSLVNSAPVITEGFTTLGHSLSVSQRDFRVNNNFTDASANNNTTPHVNYPGALGATMAIWKGHVEWQSDPHGNGAGDPVGGNILGSGNANLDFSFQGETTSTCNFCRTHRELPGSSGSTLAFMTGGSSWHIRYYATWSWQDGPGSVGGTDIQGVACHEVGHALGLGHTTVGGSTMTAFSNGTADRSIASDDIAGVQAIYGAEGATKPHITGISGTFEPGTVLTITGSNFSASNNQAWFTSSGGTQTILTVTGLASTNGGTQIDVVIPAGAVDGNLLVRRNQTGNASLSNAWPINILTGSGDPPVVTGLSQTSGPNAGYTPINIFGVGFTGTTTVRFGDIDAISFNVLGPANIEVVTPPGTLNEVVDVTVIDDDGTSVLPSAYTYTFNDSMDVDTVSPSTGPTAGGTTVSISGANAVPAFGATFDGVAGTDLAIVSQNEFTIVTPPGSAGAVDVEANGFGNVLLPAAFTYEGDAGTFTDLGPGVAGATTPLLTGSGDLTPGSATGFTLNLTDGPAFAGGIWWISLSEAPNTLLCGPLYPSIPFLLEVNIFTNGAGEITVPGSMPLGSDGLSLVMQMWFNDPTACFSASATNGLRVDVP